MGLPGTEIEEEVTSRTRDKTEEPPMYKVLLHNDDYTTMEFVVDVLMQIFTKTSEEAFEIMLKVHREGIGLCGIYTYEIAETKVNIVQSVARENSFPLQCTMEKE